METKTIRQMLRSSLICRICGDVARGMNFDVMTCMSCKSFFRRNAIQPTSTRRCIQKYNCEITKENRSSCAACRLKKCFAFGMKPQLIRSFDHNQLPTAQLLSLLQNDRSTLTFEQWNLLSNIIHAYDKLNPIDHMKHLLGEGLSLPVKMRAKPSFALGCIHHCITSVELLIRQSSHFHSLAIDARRVLITRNTIYTSYFNSCLITHEINYLIDLNFEMSFTGIYGTDIFKKVIIIHERLDLDDTLVKIMMFVNAFTSNCSLVALDSSYDMGTKSISINLIHIQDIYVTLLWNYLIYQYGFYEAVLRYCSLIKIILDIFIIWEETLSTGIYEEVFDTTVKQIEHSYIIIMDGAGGNPGNGGGFDPCECINMIQMNHERAMNRLTDILRNAQTTCTDTECFTGPLPGVQNTGGNAGMTNTYIMLAIWFGIALLLFFLRPRALRNNREHLGKPKNQGPHRDGQDPPGPQIQ